MPYTQTEFQNSMRLTLEPAHLAAQLPEASAPISTTLVADTPKNLEGVSSLTLTSSQDFTYDTGPNARFYFSRTGATGVKFVLSTPMSFSQTLQTPGAHLHIRAYVNGVAVDGVFCERTIGDSNTIGVVVLGGHLELNGDTSEGAGDGDYVEIYVESDKAGDFNVNSFATSIKEEAP